MEEILEILTLLLSCIICRGLGIQDCAMLSVQGHHTQYQVTDGKELVVTTWNTNRQLVSCSLEEDEGTVRSFLSQCTRQHDVLYMDYGGFAEARMACLYFLQSSQPGNERNGQHARVKRGFTYPGTLWCGAGNIAEKETDLGEHRETDSCCRTHDHCEHVIHPLTSDYGYWNLRWHTISHCQCDNKFKECLRNVNDTASRVVGQAFFNVIRVQCFEFSYKQQCAKRTWYGWCEEYVNMTVAVPKDSNLFDYGGNLIDKPTLSKEIDSTKPPSTDLSPEPPTLGQVMKATEDLLKIMMTISPGTSPDQSKVDDSTAGKNKADKKKKERKNKKGKGLKGKRKKSKKENVDSPAKDIWDEKSVKDEKAEPENQPLDILDVEPKQNAFNDVLNDEPIRNNDAKTPTPMTTTYIKVKLQEKITSAPPVSRPCTQKPPRKNRKERKGRKERKKKPKTESCSPSNMQ
ncbi:protein PROCA1 [Pyxicephalus adspersus]|uniref:phospholipase A2 n=1 Tax=Pyxicephalus adspersus TaxID=30357 RepID=A0AAV3AS49_PYXAD|nr:TPA: hypothetical protein GDO54_001867 [Pyxicephalus adspersus]